MILDFDKEPDLGEQVLRKGFAEEIAKFHKQSSDQRPGLLSERQMWRDVDKGFRGLPMDIHGFFMVFSWTFNVLSWIFLQKPVTLTFYERRIH